MARGLQIRRDEDATVIGYLRDDGHWSAVRIADDSDPETVAGQLKVLAESITRKPHDFGGSFNTGRSRG